MDPFPPLEFLVTYTKTAPCRGTKTLGSLFGKEVAAPMRNSKPFYHTWKRWYLPAELFLTCSNLKCWWWMDPQLAYHGSHGISLYSSYSCTKFKCTAVSFPQKCVAQTQTFSSWMRKGGGETEALQLALLLISSITNGIVWRAWASGSEQTWSRFFSRGSYYSQSIMIRY